MPIDMLIFHGLKQCHHCPKPPRCHVYKNI